jgi:cytochrome c
MSDLRVNTILGAVLASGLVVMGLRIGVGEAFKPEFPAKPGYDIDISSMTSSTSGGGTAAPAQEGPVDWGRTLTDASLVETGHKLTTKCASCHNFDKGGPNMTGPNLYGVLGRSAGTHAGFNYSAGMKGYAQQWSYDNINQFLGGPQKFVNGTLMTFVGLKKQDERTAVIAYLRSISDSPPPLPAPLAAAPAAAPAGGAPAATPAKPAK